MVSEATSPKMRMFDRKGARYGVPVVLMCGAALGWWWSVRMAKDMGGVGGVADMAGMSMVTVSVAGFFVAWLAMMAAMMLPAMTPVVKLYARASAQHRVAPLVYFVGGYLVVWMLLGVPAYFAWRALSTPISEGATWAARVAGASFVAAGIWQLTPLKELCLRHCRSPLSFFLRFGGRIQRPLGAARMGATHGLFCVGCCWAMFALLVALGTMNIGWMLILTALIVAEKVTRHGERVALIAGAAFVVIGAVLLLSPGGIRVIT